jgi:SAM-dependent methyltransferase
MAIFRRSTPRADLDEAALIAERQRAAHPERAPVEDEHLRRFAPHVDEPVDQEQANRWLSEAAELEPWLQGPFQLAPGVVVEGHWRNDDRWFALDARIGDLRGKRVLDIGSNAGYDAFAFKALGAREVVACEPFAFIEQALFLERIYRSGVEFRRMGWQGLDPAVDGTFDLVHCNGVLYHEPEPLAMLKRLGEMVAPGGELLLGTMMLEDPADDEKLRFVERDFSGDESWWFVPGRAAVASMLRVAGIDAALDPGLQFGALSGPFGVVNGYLRGPRTAAHPALHAAPVLRSRGATA